MSKNISILSGRKGLENNLFDKLGKLKAENESLSSETLQALAEEFLVGNAITYGTSTFYDFLKPENQGKRVYVCNGSACLCADTQPELTKKLEQFVDAAEIGHMTCLGRCHENSAFHYQEKNYSALNDEALHALFSKNALPTSDTYHVASNSVQVLTHTTKPLSYFRELISQQLGQSPEIVLEELKLSGIRGRGGAGFPLASKLGFCKDAQSDIKFIICNADEGDPGAYSDRYLLEQQPFLVLAGMLLAGYVTGASWGVLYIRAEYPESVSTIEEAIKSFASEGLVGENILGTNFTFSFKVIKAQGAYICGEETALINSIEGQRPEVRVRPPYPAQAGLFNKPTVVNNVETLAAIPFILEKGGKTFAQLGTEKSSGTKLLSLDSTFNRPGIYEIEMGTPLDVVIDQFGKGFKRAVKALHIGGPLGGIVPIHKVKDLQIDFESFSSEGFLLGHASIVSIPKDFPMIDYLRHLMEFAAYESCGKCFPCRLGTQRGFELLDKAIEESTPIDKTLFDDLLHTLTTGSLCAHGGGIPLPIRNALTYFEDELAPYFV